MHGEPTWRTSERTTPRRKTLRAHALAQQAQGLE